MEKVYSVYILASRRNGTLYAGVTNNLAGRVWQHKTKQVKGFTAEYDVCLLVHHESYSTAREAIQREKNIKKWPRQWKLNLIEQDNPQWRDLYEELNH